MVTNLISDAYLLTVFLLGIRNTARPGVEDCAAFLRTTIIPATV